jgi:hypothetical protein
MGDHIEGHQWREDSCNSFVAYVKCLRCGWKTNSRALNQRSGCVNGVNYVTIIANKEWADIPSCDDALVQHVLEI